ncbi:TonB-dependent receptor [Acidomonas methanolica]|uniref:TonB-dependent receptor n=1 Tax=Acidomonas methanolica TaxID=437 RepID=UPI00211A6377|nr:TonB-dependent receptor [Acidomonas methanolica]MCQ9156435.1 TonB-dependent receptor plug domain-containing protein [Acidomonas methanolica]
MAARIAFRCLLVSTILTQIPAQFPVLAIGSAAQAATRHRSAASSRPTAAKPAAPAAAPHARRPALPKAETVTVTGLRDGTTAGGGQMRVETAAKSVETLTRAFIATQSPTASPVTLMASLPSVNVNAADGFGLQGGSNVQMHGLTGNDIGWLLDGTPVYNSGTGYANEITDAEDLETLSVAPGSSNIADPTVSSAAGTIYMSMRAPSEKMGAKIEASGGSYDLDREYIRLDSGEIGHSGVRGFASFSHTRANNWRGAGGADKKHVDFKVLKDFTGGSFVTLEGSFNQEYYDYYYYPTADQAKNYKASYNDFNTNKNYSGLDDYSYYRLNGETPFNVMLLSMPSHFVLNRQISIDDTPYVWIAYGAGEGASVLTQGQTYMGPTLVDVDLTAGGKVPLTDGSVMADTGFRVQTIQAGNVMDIKWKTRYNTLTAGWWYENYNQQETDPVAIVNQTTGRPASIWNTRNYYHLANGSVYYSQHANEFYDTHTLFIGDTVSLFKDKLNVTAGFKDVISSIWVTNMLPGAPYRNGRHSNTPLPHFSAHYQIDPHNQVYVNAEADFRLPFTYSMLSTYSVGSGALLSRYASPKNEVSIKEELGYRYHDDLLTADISFFNLNMTNRLLTLNMMQNGSQVSETTNAGGQTSRGVDAQIGTRPLWNFLSPYASFEYLHASIDNNVATLDNDGNATYLPTRGKTQVMSPHFQVAAGLNADWHNIFGGIRFRYVSSQYSTLMNDEKMNGYATDDLTIGYRFHAFGVAKTPKIQLNIINITNARFRSGVYQYQYNAQSVRALNGNMVSASGAPLYYIQPAFTGVVSLSTDF